MRFVQYTNTSGDSYEYSWTVYVAAKRTIIYIRKTSINNIRTVYASSS